MKTCIPLDWVLLVGILSLLAASETRAERVPAPTLEIAESRLRAIYDRNEFRAKQFRADWLPDSSGYTVMEPGPDGKEQVLVPTMRRAAIEPSWTRRGKKPPADPATFPQMARVSCSPNRGICMCVI